MKGCCLAALFGAACVVGRSGPSIAALAAPRTGFAATSFHDAGSGNSGLLSMAAGTRLLHWMVVGEQPVRAQASMPFDIPGDLSGSA